MEEPAQAGVMKSTCITCPHCGVKYDSKTKAVWKQCAALVEAGMNDPLHRCKFRAVAGDYCRTHARTEGRKSE
jgi:hypothetical protein